VSAESLPVSSWPEERPASLEQASDHDEERELDSELPVVVDDVEFVERAVGKEHLAAGGRLKWQALRPRPNEDGASVIRQRIGDDAVKNTAVRVKNNYRGLAECSVQVARDGGLAVVDPRRENDYEGHAEILFRTFPEPLEPYEPNEASDQNAEASRYYRSYLRLFRFELDPAPDEEGWSGGPLGRHVA